MEVYDLDETAGSDLTNISTRGFVQGGEHILIGGFILGHHNGGSRIVVRAIGPSLTGFGIAAPLQDPVLDLYNSSGTRIAADDDWKDSQEIAIERPASVPAIHVRPRSCLCWRLGPTPQLFAATMIRAA